MLKISDFNISGESIPQTVADKIYLYHAIPLNVVREELIEIDVRVSQRSGYRPTWWEKQAGRDGTSEHCFRGNGAVDITCDDFSENKEQLVEALIKYTNYQRIAVYNTFIHCDYKPNGDGKRWIFDSKWRRVKIAK